MLKFNISSICSAIWGLAVISGEAANAAEMEVLSNRATRSVMEMSASNVANVAWALASVRHSNEGLWLAFNEYAEQKGFKGIDVFKLTALCWATSHLQMSGEGIVKGISKWMSYVPETTTSAEKEYGMKYQTGKGKAWGKNTGDRCS